MAKRKQAAKVPPKPVPEKPSRLGTNIDRLTKQNDRLAKRVRKLAVSQEALHNAFDDRIDQTLDRFRAEVTQKLAEMQKLSSLQNQDLLILLRRLRDFAPPVTIRLETAHPVGLETDDHKFPRGTRKDNTRYPRFVRKCEEILGHPLHFLDLGCAGGGLVLDFLLRGHLAVGLEGSDYSLKFQRAEWRIIPEFLHTCDITQPFRLLDDKTGDQLQFHVISSWEVLEHLPEQALPALLENIRTHLLPSGIFAASVATFEDFDPATKARWHVTVHERDWWANLFQQHGFEIAEGLFEPLDFPRGSGNGLDDWSVLTDPDRGFHLTARLPADKKELTTSPA